MQPTYTKEEILNLIHLSSDFQDMKPINDLIREELTLYSINDLETIQTATKAKMTEIADEYRELSENIRQFMWAMFRAFPKSKMN